MISMFVYDTREKEIRPLETIIRDLAAHLTEEKWEISAFASGSEKDAYLKMHPLIDMSCYDITESGAVTDLQEFRENYEDTGLMLIADTSISPMEYLKPGIRPDSLLMRPLNKSMVYDTMRDFFTSYMREADKKGGIKSYVIESKEGKINIPYQDIYYFEAREKKIYIRTLHEEYGFYETIENLEAVIPDVFMRCHRSYIVNRDKIQKIMLSQSMMELADGFDVPLSRSFKPLFKNFGK